MPTLCLIRFMTCVGAHIHVHMADACSNVEGEFAAAACPAMFAFVQQLADGDAQDCEARVQHNHNNNIERVTLHVRARSVALNVVL